MNAGIGEGLSPKTDSPRRRESISPFKWSTVFPEDLINQDSLKVNVRLALFVLFQTQAPLLFRLLVCVCLVVNTFYKHKAGFNYNTVEKLFFGAIFLYSFHIPEDTHRQNKLHFISNLYRTYNDV